MTQHTKTPVLFLVVEPLEQRIELGFINWFLVWLLGIVEKLIEAAIPPWFSNKLRRIICEFSSLCLPIPKRNCL
jgi:hypothetical protein